jgi:hypothetical protein
MVQILKDDYREAYIHIFQVVVKQLSLFGGMELKYAYSLDKMNQTNFGGTELMIVPTIFSLFKQNIIV